MKARLVLGLLPVVMALAGCASGGLSGIGGSSDYACAAPPGVSCMSVTGISINAAKGNLPALKRGATEEVGAAEKDGEKSDASKEKKPVAYMTASVDGVKKVSPATMDAPYSGTPLRTPPRILRVWMAPFEDAESDLHDQKYLYVTVHTGRWVLEANQLNIQPSFKQTFPLGKKEEAVDDAGSRGAGPAVDGNGEAGAERLGAPARRQ